VVSDQQKLFYGIMDAGITTGKGVKEKKMLYLTDNLTKQITALFQIMQ
jgi:hypothetical protein